MSKQWKQMRAALHEQDAWASMSFGGFGDDWSPFIYVAAEAEPAKQEGEAEAAKEEPQIFEEADERSRDRDHFGSVHDFCEAPFKVANNRPLFEREHTDGRGVIVKGGSKNTSERSNMEWFGAATPREAMDRAVKGWPEGAQRALGMMEEIDAPPPQNVRRRTVRSDQGDELDVHAVYRGDLDRAWSRRVRRPTRSRLTVRVVARIDGAYHVQAERLFWRGAAVLKLVDMLEKAGYSVEVLGGQFLGNVDRDDRGMLTTFTLKDAGAPLDVEQFAGVLCNAGFFRTFGFRAIYACASFKLRSLGAESLVTSRTGISWSDIAEEGRLAADGTQTFVAPTSIGGLDGAKAWVAKVVKELEQENVAA